MPRDTKLYTDFGVLFFNILAEYLHPNSRKNKNAVADYLLRLLERKGVGRGSGYRVSVFAWLRGDIAGKHCLTPEHFLEILKFLAEENSFLLLFEDIEALVEAGRDDYKIILQDESIRQFRGRIFRTVSLPLHRIPREGLENQIIEILSGEETQIVILHGPPGRGKKTLMGTISQRHPNTLPVRVIPLPAQTVDDLKAWIQFEVQFPRIKASKIASFLLEEFRRFFNGRSVLFTVADCRELEVVELLEAYLPQGCKLIITTHHMKVARAAASPPVVQIPPFTEEETLKYMQAHIHGQTWAVEDFRKFYHLTLGAPLTLHFAHRLVREHGMQVVLDKLNIPPTLDESEELTSLHRVIWLGFESLSLKFQKAFGKISLLQTCQSYDLLTFQALWQRSPNSLLDRGEAQAILEKLCYQAGLIQALDTGEWTIHPIVRKFSVEAAQIVASEELELAKHWFSTALHSAEIQEGYQNALRRAYSSWKSASFWRKQELLRSPLPYKYHIIVRAFRSLFHGKSVDMYQVLNNKYAHFSSGEMYYIKLSEQASAKSFKPYVISMIVMVASFLAAHCVSVLWAMIGITAVLFILIYSWKDLRLTLKRGLLVFEIWRQKISPP
jgi:hypothetical protein